MFRVNDTVMYGSSGACKITGEVEKEYLGNIEKCFVLEPIFGNNLKIYVPLGNEHLVSKMHALLSRGEVMEIIKNLPEKGEEYIPNDNLRRQKYSEIISSGDRKRVGAVLKTLYDKKSEQLENKKKLHQCDEFIMREAEKLIYDEFAIVLGVDHDKVHDYIITNK